MNNVLSFSFLDMANIYDLKHKPLYFVYFYHNRLGIYNLTFTSRKQATSGKEGGQERKGRPAQAERRAGKSGIEPAQPCCLSDEKPREIITTSRGS